MGQVVETVKVANSVVRTFLVLVLLGGLGAAGFFGYRIYYEQELLAEAQRVEIEKAKRELGELADTVRKQEHEIERLDTSLRLLKVDHRVARIDVLDQRTDPATGRLLTTIEFIELNEEGNPVDDVRQFEIVGDMIYLDNWLVKFDDKFVEQAEIDRSTSLVLFRRIFGEHQEPSAGFTLDRRDGPPRAYARGGKPSEFEKKIWDEFWLISNDEAKAAELGIRAAHGQAVSIKAQKGKSYRVLLRASDGLTIVPDGPVPVKKAS